METLTIAVDPSASHLRGFSTLDSFKPGIILLDPEVTKVPKQSIERYEEKDRLGSTGPEISAWVEYKGEYWAVGQLARKRFGADLQLKKPKFELALPKVLAMVGALAEKHELPNGTPIRLGILFPCGEYQKRATFKQLISDALANFRFRGKERSFLLDTFVCLPEGGGALARGRAPGSSLKEQIVYVVMIGFRDVSILPVERGDMNNGYTEPRGMSNMVLTIKKGTGITDIHKLLTAICKAGKGVNPRALTGLVENVDLAYRDSELSNIRQVILEAREEYWMMLSQWLRLQVPREADEIILVGGTANYFRPELNTLFSHSQINWCEELEKQLNVSFATQINSKSLHYRLTDVYGLFFYLCGIASQARRASHV